MLWDYQKEFEWPANRVVGWPQKALIGTFLGGLKEEIASKVGMFKPKTLWEIIEFAKMMDERLSRQKIFLLPIVNNGDNYWAQLCYSNCKEKELWGDATTKWKRPMF